MPHQNQKNLDVDQHKARHRLLLSMFEELSADYLQHQVTKTPAGTTIAELLRWAGEQTTNPTVVDGR